MDAGKRLSPPTPLAQLRTQAADQLAKLPEELRQFGQGRAIEVKVSPRAT